MKTTLDHLPPRKQDELRAVTDVLRAGVPMSLLILFGSHARGDWVEDPEEGYFSDYDLLAIVESPKVVDDAALWTRLETEAAALIGEAALSLIVHDIRFVNSEIRAGSYFFGDIRNEGIVLHDAHRFTLATPKEANPRERLERAERNFTFWFDSAKGFIVGCDLYAGQKLYNHAVFQLHQAAERLYVTANLVFTGYKRKEHNLQKLHEEAAPIHPDIAAVLPRSTPEDKHLFDLLRRAYIDARYDKSYRITVEELATLGERVRAFAAVVERVSQEKIASLRVAADAVEE